jgi:hypothetical protein
MAKKPVPPKKGNPAFPPKGAGKGAVVPANKKPMPKGMPPGSKGAVPPKKGAAVVPPKKKK